MCSDVFGCVRMCSDVFGCVRMCSDVFGCVRMCSDVFGVEALFGPKQLRRSDGPGEEKKERPPAKAGGCGGYKESQSECE